MWYLAFKLTIPGVKSPIILALIKMLVNSLYFTMAELTRTGSRVPGYINRYIQAKYRKYFWGVITWNKNKIPVNPLSTPQVADQVI